jgi:hypothetical protein
MNGVLNICGTHFDYLSQLLQIDSTDMTVRLVFPTCITQTRGRALSTEKSQIKLKVISEVSNV